ncbi:hypothetical protein QJQ45_028898 [Haematococcus lacustris]|nr:hypothetical protein QJQ45_028898 [Haematococcus lacustris]
MPFSSSLHGIRMSALLQHTALGLSPRRSPLRALSTLIYSLAALGCAPANPWLATFYSSVASRLPAPASSLARRRTYAREPNIAGIRSKRLVPQPAENDMPLGAASHTARQAEPHGAAVFRRPMRNRPAVGSPVGPSPDRLLGRALARTLWGLAVLGARPPKRWLSLLLHHAQPHLAHCQAHDLTLLGVAVHRMRCCLHPDWWRAASAAVTSQLGPGSRSSTPEKESFLASVKQKEAHSGVKFAISPSEQNLHGSMDKQACKVFCEYSARSGLGPAVTSAGLTNEFSGSLRTAGGGLSWETSSERLRAYFENFGVVREAFVSYNRNNGRPRGFGFVVFESPEVADKVVATKHMVDRREVECKRAVPKEEQAGSVSLPSRAEGASSSQQSRATRKVFVGGLAPAVDEKMLRQHFGQFGSVEDAVVMYDHDNKRPRGFGFVTFAEEDSVDKVFSRGVMQTILDKQIEIKPAVPRDQMPSVPPTRPVVFEGQRGGFGIRAGPAAVSYGSNDLAYSLQSPPFGNGNAAGLRGYGARVPFDAPQAGMMGMSTSHSDYSAALPLGEGLGAPFGSSAMSHSRGQQASQQQAMPLGYEQLYSAAAAAGLPNGTASMLSSSAQQALYNLANFQPHINGGQGSTGAKLSAFNPNNLNLKALALASTLSGLTRVQPDSSAYQPDSNTYASSDVTADFAEAAAANLSAAAVAAAASSLSMPGNYSSYDHSFATSPAPGWSS